MVRSCIFHYHSTIATSDHSSLAVCTQCNFLITWTNLLCFTRANLSCTNTITHTLLLLLERPNQSPPMGRVFGMLTRRLRAWELYPNEKETLFHRRRRKGLRITNENLHYFVFADRAEFGPNRYSPLALPVFGCTIHSAQAINLSFSAFSIALP